MTPSTAARLIRPEIQKLSAYAIPDHTGLLKLDAMENPYPWPGALPLELQNIWLERVKQAQLNRYPDPDANSLKLRLREAADIPQDMDIILGNGSDELIQLIAMAIATPDRVVLAPEPSFVMYRMIAAFTGMHYVGVPLRENDFGLDLDEMLRAIEQYKPALVFLAYPNNPTGNLFAEKSIHEIINATPGLVVIDEAYYAFAEQTLMQRLHDYDNLLLMRTVSKLGLAGLRLGFLIGPKHWLDEIDKLRLPYNINTLTQLSVEFALEHLSILEQQAARIRSERSHLTAALAALPGITPLPSKANFIFFRTPDNRAEIIFKALRENGVLIKNLGTSGGLLRDCLRVTVATQEQNRRFLDALRASLPC